MITVFSSENLIRFRQVGDEQLVALMDGIDHHSLRELWSLKNDGELFDQSLNPSLRKLVSQLCVLPAWSNPEQIQQSSVFFQKYMQDLLMMLGLVSLPYCYGGADGSKVLVASQRILSNTSIRLRETGTFVWDVCDEDAFSGVGKGFLSCLKVRLIHQFTRNKLLQEGWDIEKNGYPVNQLDQAGTNLSFSLIAMRAMRKTGTSISGSEMESYIHRWNVVSSLLGLDERLVMNSVREASMLSRSIEKCQFRKSIEGLKLTKALLNSIYQQAGFSEAYKRVLAPYMGYLIGQPTAGYLGLDKKSGISNFFEFNLLLTQLKTILPWVPIFGFDRSDSEGKQNFESMLAEIPMLN